ncbi:MAG: hypothetical protein NTAFB05_03700 [Nitrobacter sp.]|uniref:hypothetical protein n=1 Tax=Nitrobacter sp. TaxID=29420 RepID=UPI00387DD98A
MRRAGQNGWDVLRASGMLPRGVRLAAVAAGIAVVLSSSVARAQDDDDSTFEEKIIKNIMSGIGATNMDNKGINYRERSPLVIPPKIDLPPPGSAATEVRDPNWPKDPDAQRHKELVAARKQRKPVPEEEGASILPSKLATHGSGTERRAETEQPGQPPDADPSLSPSQLGFTGKLLNLFGGNKPQTATFTGEPEREELTQPPAGYQTPSPNYAYGTGPKEALGNTYIDVNTGKERKE